MIPVRFLAFALIAVLSLPAFAASRSSLHLRVLTPPPHFGSYFGGIVSVAFSPDGCLVASGGRDGKIRLWDTRTGRQRAMWQAGRGSISGLAFSPDGRRLIGQISYPSYLFLPPKKRGPGQVQVWDVRAHRLWWSRPTDALEGGVALSPDGRLLAVGEEVKYTVPKGCHLPYGGPGRGGGIRLRNLRTGRLVRRLYAESNPYYGEKDVQPPNWVDHLHFSSNGRTLAGIALFGGGCGDLTLVQRWSVRTGRLQDALSGDEDADTLAFSPRRPQFALVGSRFVRLWNTRNGTPERSLFDNPNAGGRQFLSACFSPDGQTIAIGEERSVTLWNARTGRGLRRLPAHGRDVATVAFSPDGRMLATGSSDGWLELWPVR